METQRMHLEEKDREDPVGSWVILQSFNFELCFMVRDETLLSSHFPLQHGLRDFLDQEERSEKEGSRGREGEDLKKKEKARATLDFIVLSIDKVTKTS